MAMWCRRILMAAVVAWSCGSEREGTPPYASSASLAQPAIFAPGVVSTELPEFATTFTPDGRTVLFNIATPDRGRLTMVASRFTNGRWEKPEPLPFAGSYRDVDPFVTADGSRLYFSSNRPFAGSEPRGDFDTWYAEWKGEAWGDPIRLDSPLNTDSSEVFVSVAADGTLYFSSDRSGNGDIYRARLDGGRYAAPEALGPEINTPGSEGNPAIAPDQSFLVFVAERAGGMGGADLYVSYRRDDRWTEARNLGPAVNSAHADFAPYVTADGRYLFFTSERPGIVADPGPGRPPGDIYQVEVAAFARHPE